MAINDYNEIEKKEIKTEVCEKNGKYGVIDTDADHIVIPFKYDNIYKLHPHAINYQIFILHQSGKFGAIFVNSNFICTWIAPCEYDRYIGYWDLLFYNDHETRCYFLQSNFSKVFLKAKLIGHSGYIFAEDDNSYYILRSYTGEILWQDSINDPKYYHVKPCLLYLGEVNGLPVFDDCGCYGQIFPNKDGVLEYGHMGEVIRPIIIGGTNIVTVIDGVGVIDIRQEAYEETDCDFDEVTVELKVSLKKGSHTEERVYPIPNGSFTPDSFLEHSDDGW